MRIRILEDNEAIAGLLQYALEDVEPDVWTEGFDKFMDPDTWKEVDVALVDYNLGGDVNGCDVLNLIGAHHPECKRILFTGSTDRFDNCDFNVVLKKLSLKLEEIRTTLGLNPVREVLSGKSE